MRKTVRITYNHWKKPDIVFTVEGVEVPSNPQSDRIIIEKQDGSFEDIIKTTIIKKEFI